MSRLERANLEVAGAVKSQLIGFNRRTLTRENFLKELAARNSLIGSFALQNDDFLNLFDLKPPRGT